MSIIAWIVLGAIAGYLAGFLVKGDEGLGVIGHIVLGIVGALVGGFLAGVLFNSKPIDGPFDISSIVVAVIGADHHGRRGRHGHQQHPDGPRLDLTRDHGRNRPARHPLPTEHPPAGRWRWCTPPRRVGDRSGSPHRLLNATAGRAVAPATPAPPCWSSRLPCLGVRGPRSLPRPT